MLRFAKNDLKLFESQNVFVSKRLKILYNVSLQSKKLEKLQTLTET